MANVKFLAALEIRMPPKFSGRSAACSQPASSFESNLARVLGLLNLPLLVGASSQAWCLSFNAAVDKVVGKITEESAHALKDPKVIEEAMNFMAENMKLEGKTGIFTNSVAGNLQMFLGFTPGLPSPLEELMKSAIVQFWTSFETLAEDLWESALNEHPEYLSQLNGADSNERSEKKQFPLNLLEKYNFNVSQLMGTVLKDRYKFRALPGIRRAYLAAFAKSNERIKTAISATAFDALACVRNVIVHRSGIADKEFLDAVRHIKLAPLCDTAEEGKPLAIDGEIVKSLAVNMIAAATELTHSVDEWLQGN